MAFCEDCNVASESPPLQSEQRKTENQKLIAWVVGAVVLWSILVVIFLSNKDRDNDQSKISMELSEQEEPEQRVKTWRFCQVDMANIRAEPSIKGEIIEVLHEGEKVELLEMLNDWTKIQKDTIVGWTASRLLETQNERKERLRRTKSESDLNAFRSSLRALGAFP